MMSSTSHGKSTVSTSSPYFADGGNGSYDLLTSLHPSLLLPNYSTGDPVSPSGTVDSYSHDELMIPGLLHSHIQQQHQDLMDRYHKLLIQLQDTAKQAQTIYQENINLKMANLSLNKNLNMVLNSMQSGMSGVEFLAGLDSVADGLWKMNLNAGGMGQGEDEGMSENEVVPLKSLTSVIDSSQVGRGEDRVALPKSISVRSSGYLKAARAGGSSGTGGRCTKALKESKNQTGMQKVYVKGGKEQLELEVYNQGMFKTELCNKWQETGACPYGDQCQFAHGIEELRPVLRHPRYKTEVCRMVLNGDPCPYGHRCHFRHALTEEEKLERAMSSRALKPVNYR